MAPKPQFTEECMATVTATDDASRASASSDIQELWLRFKADPENEDLRNRLVEQYLPLVKYNGERIWARLPEGVELDDLVSAGIFGLMDAIDAFDLSRGVKFERYDMPDMYDNDILTAGGANSARFKDSEGNIMAVIQTL